MNLLGKTTVQLLDLLKTKYLSPKELFNYFLNRSKKYNSKLNSYITLNTKYNSSNKSNLFGLPISFKDNFLTTGIKTTAASKVLENFIPPYSATVVDRLLDKGASILGKTNMDAWAHGSSTETSDFGPSKNPWDITRSPGGSSGGSASSVAAFLSPISIGSETAGSIRQPASWCGLVGLKPTYGGVSRYGVIAMGSSLDSPGVLSRSVEDAALILSIIAGKDEYDGTTVDLVVPEFVKSVKTTKKYTIGVPEEYLRDIEPSIKKNVLNAIEIFKKLGHHVKRIKLIDPNYSVSIYTIIQRAEVSSNLARYDGIRYGNDRASFGNEAKKRIMLGAFTLSQGYIDEYYTKAQKIRTLIINDFNEAFKKVDLIIAPTTPNTALKLGEFKKYPFFGELMDRLNEPSSVSGLPGISIPVGLDDKNLPTAVQIIGRSFDEESILNLAHQFEKETNFFNIYDSLLKKYPEL